MQENITRIKTGDKEFIILGTAHVSSASVEEVQQLIGELRPDHVCVEIDAGRYASLTKQSSWAELDLGRVLKQGKGFLLLANLALAAFQKRVSRQLETRPGQEMLQAITTAQEFNIPFTLCDREIQLTLKRAWAKTGFFGKIKMVAVLAGAVLFEEKLSAAEIEKLKEQSELENMLQRMSLFLPAVKSVLVDERDQYLATRIFNTPGTRILAVVGAGHARGIAARLSDPAVPKTVASLTALMVIPQPAKITRILPWILPAVLLLLLAGGFLLGGFTIGLQMFLTWWLVNGCLAALGAIFALAHPLTIGLAFLGAPLTSLNPLLAVGMLTGILEYRLRKPRVADFEGLSEDITSLRGFFKNRVTHILLVFLFSSLGSIAGTFIGFPWIASLLAAA